MFLVLKFDLIKILDLVFAIIIAVLLLVFIIKLTKRKYIAILSSLLLLGIIVTGFFNLFTTMILLGVTYLGVVSAVLVVYTRNLRVLLLPSKGNRNLVELDQDKKQRLFNEVMDAVLSLSATKTGAIITFERNDSLSNYIKAGEEVNAPVTSRLLKTIFTVGTPFHDGAVIIKGDLVASASVFYTPTTRPLNGKYGARHRAGIGISEVSDSLTIIVSEETGRISFAQYGELSSVSRENFARHLKEILL